jgi:prophage regulatory protein
MARQPDSPDQNRERRDAGARLLNKWQLEERTTLDITTIYRKMKKRQFPQPLRVTSHRVAWRESDVQEWQDRLPVGVAKAPNPLGGRRRR